MGKGEGERREAAFWFFPVQPLTSHCSSLGLSMMGLDYLQACVWCQYLP